MKKVFKYISLVLIMLVGLAAVGLLLIFFVPNLTIFNITSINYNQKLVLEKQYESSQINTIVLNSNKFDVRVVEVDNGSINCVAHANTFGYAFKQNSVFKMDEDFELGILTITVQEPNGFAFPNNSSIELRIPKDLTPSLILNNNSSVVEINEDVKVNNLSYETKNGKLTIDKSSILGDLDLKINSGEVYIEEETDISNSNIILSITSGRFASKSNFNSLTVKDLTYGRIEINDCNNLTCKTNKAGYLNVNQISNLAEIKSSDLEVSINKANNIIVELSEDGSVAIGEVNGVNSFKTNRGSITVNKSTNVLDVYSNNGNIYLNNATKEIVAKSISGNITISFAEEAANYTTSNSNRSVLAELEDGVLKVNDVQHIRAVLKGSSSCNIKMTGVLGGENLISLENGSANVIVPFDSVYKLTTQSNGNVRVNLMQIPEYNGYTTTEETITNVNCAANTNPSNSMVVKAKDGSIVILDTKLS